MPKSISDRPFYVIAVNAIERETDMKVNLFVMEEEPWSTTTNIGEAFMFYDKNVAKDVANELKAVLKSTKELIASHIVILAVEFNVSESEEISIEP